MERRLAPRYDVHMPVLISFTINGYESDDIGYMLNVSRGGAAVYSNKKISTNRALQVHFGASVGEIKEPIRFVVLECCESRENTSYPYRLRIVLKDRRKGNMDAMRNLVHRIKAQLERSASAG